MTGPVRPSIQDVFHLEYPQSVGVFATYEEAQKVVDYLADQEFAVENLCIVGTDLRSVERVLGRRTWGTVIRAGAQQGLTTGLMIGLLMWLFMPSDNVLAIVVTALLIGIAIGIAMQAIAYATSRGKRDFTSITQTVATRYEVLSEHKVAGKAREVIAKMPGARAAAFAPQAAPVPGQTPYGQAAYPTGSAQMPYYPGYPSQPYPYPYPPAFPPASAGSPAAGTPPSATSDETDDPSPEDTPPNAG